MAEVGCTKIAYPWAVGLPTARTPPRPRSSQPTPRFESCDLRLVHVFGCYRHFPQVLAIRRGFDTRHQLAREGGRLLSPQAATMNSTAANQGPSIFEEQQKRTRLRKPPVCYKGLSLTPITVIIGTIKRLTKGDVGCIPSTPRCRLGLCRIADLRLTASGKCSFSMRPARSLFTTPSRKMTSSIRILPVRRFV